MVNRLALFDLDRTLTDRDAFFRDWAEGFVRRHELEAGTVDWLVELDAGGYGSKPTLFSRVKDRFRLDLDVERAVVDFYTELGARHRLAPTVADALRALRRAGWRLGVVTNGSGGQLDKVRAAGLDELVDAVAVSGLDGIAKPKAGLFAIAAERAGAELAGGWMVGDNPHLDIVGGAEAGLTTVWLERGRQWPLDGVAPDHVVEGVPQAVELMLATPPKR